MRMGGLFLFPGKVMGIQGKHPQVGQVTLRAKGKRKDTSIKLTIK